MPKKLTLQEVKRRVKEKGFIFLDKEYNGNRNKYSFKCLKHNKICKATYKQIYSGSGLKCCGYINRIKGLLYTLQEVKKISLEKGFTFLDNFYNGCRFQHRFKCLEHNEIHTTRFDSIVEGRGLRCCLVSSNRRNNDKLSKIMVGENHPNWNEKLTAEERRIGRMNSGDQSWRKNIKKRDNYQCQICKDKEKLHAHHLMSYASNKKKRLDMDNGVTLCEKHHILFHHEYGKLNNNKKQFLEFRRNYGNN